MCAASVLLLHGLCSSFWRFHSLRACVGTTIVTSVRYWCLRAPSTSLPLSMCLAYRLSACVTVVAVGLFCVASVGYVKQLQLPTIMRRPSAPSAQRVAALTAALTATAATVAVASLYAALASALPPLLPSPRLRQQLLQYRRCRRRHVSMCLLSPACHHECTLTPWCTRESHDSTTHEDANVHSERALLAAKPTRSVMPGTWVGVCVSNASAAA